MSFLIKRLFDIFGASLGLLVLLVPMVIIALLVWFKMGRPVFFSQTRPGKDCQLFKLYKFRTMLKEQASAFSDTQRLTPFGQFLRRTSLDELPELFNVLKGDMSLVGPRPLLVEYLPFYTKEEAQRHLVKPGLTGWAQIQGRNALTWPEKFALDNWYVKNQSFALDLKIIFMTIKQVFQQTGIAHEGCATMPRFDEGKQNDSKNSLS